MTAKDKKKKKEKDKKEKSTQEQVSLKQEITATQGEEKPWREQIRLETASKLAIFLLILFGATILVNGFVIAILVFQHPTPIPGMENTYYPLEEIKQVLEFTKTMLPYITTPLGVALGFFFRLSRVD